MKIYPERLKPGDHVRVIAPALSLAMISEENRNIASSVVAELGLTLSFGSHVYEKDDFGSSTIAARIDDLHGAFSDPTVRCVMAVIGGNSSNQLLPFLDYELIKANPKVFCGFSDITALSNAIFAKTGLVNYSGLAFSSFAMQRGNEYSINSFYECLFENHPIEISNSLEWSDDQWYLDQNKRAFHKNDGLWVLNEGSASGTLLGGNLCTLNLLQGTACMPSLEGSVLFIEDDYESSIATFTRDLHSLLQQTNARGIRGLVIGRFQKQTGMTRALLTQIIQGAPQLAQLPVIANADFGHTTPMFTFPVGGEVRISTAGDVAPVLIMRH